MPKVIIVDNKKCKLEGFDADQTKKLKGFLSFRLAGYEYTPAYRMGWNGYTYLLGKTNTFPSGLFSAVCNFLTDLGVEFTTEDNRPTYLYKEFDISKRLTALGLSPRDYQDRVVQACVENPKGIIRAATGSGKTLIAALMTAKFGKANTVIYVIGLDLLKQFHELFEEIFQEPIGWIGNGVCDVRRITIASIWTIGRSLDPKAKEIIVDDAEDEIYDETQAEKIKRCLQDARIHILDECHIAASTTITTIHRHINPERIYGMSGTPWREDGSEILCEGILGPLIIEISASELIKKGVLAKPIINFINVPKMYVESKHYQGVYKEYVVDNDVRNDLIVSNTVKLLSKGYVPLVLFKNINHGKKLFRMFQAQGIDCDILHGNDNLDKRTAIKDRITSGEQKLLLASTIFDIGLNLPILSALVLAGGGKSNIRALQRVGRVIRMYKIRGLRR
jgi:superfamily II DNA or RNA helicase